MKNDNDNDCGKMAHAKEPEQAQDKLNEDDVCKEKQEEDNVNEEEEVEVAQEYHEHIHCAEYDI